MKLFIPIHDVRASILSYFCINLYPQEYIPNTRPGIGLSSLQGGLDFYEAALRWHTTSELSAQEVHNIGQQEVARIEEQMEEFLINQGFSGTIQEYIASLKANPKNFHKSEVCSQVPNSSFHI